MFGEKARLAWKRAGQEWRQYGDRDILSYENHHVVLNSQEMHQEAARKLLARLDALSPGLREKAHKEKIDRLKPAERMALDTPPAKRTPKQFRLASEAEEKLKVTHKEVAMRLEGPKHAEAMDLARKIEEHEQWINSVSRDRAIVNFDYWRLRAEVEQSDQALSARKLIHQGDQAYTKADLGTARAAYEQGLAGWRKVLDDFPKLKDDITTQDDMIDIIKRYRHILNQLDIPFPKHFILQDIINVSKRPL